MTITEFLTARLDEDEAVAREAGGSPFKPVPRWVAGETNNAGIRREDGIPVAGHSWPHEMDHIARFDPARVLAEVEAKRRIVAGYTHPPMAGVLGDMYPSGRPTNASVRDALAGAVKANRWSGMDALVDAVTEVAQERLDAAESQRDEDVSEVRAAAARSTEAWYHDWVLRLLALPYADHPEYDEAWRP